jgi:GT2 family glycosyltransferase
MRTMFNVFVNARGSIVETEIAELIATAMLDLGHEVVFPAPGLPEAHRNTVNLVVAPHEFFPLQPDRTERELLRAAKASVSIGIEQPGTSWFELGTYYASLGSSILDISPYAIAELNRRGLDATHLQLGYHPSWDRWGGDPSRLRHKDLLFLGSMTERRSRFLGDAAPLLWDYETDIRLFEFNRLMSKPQANFVTGAEKWQLLADSRALLNVHRNDVPYFEWVRVLEAVTNGCLVVTEASTDYGPLIAGEHLLATPYEALGAYAVSLLADEPLRQEITTSAYDFIRTKLELTSILAPICETLSEQAARPAQLARSAPYYRSSSDRHPATKGELLEAARTGELRIRTRIKDLRDSGAELAQTPEAPLRFGDEHNQEVTTSSAWDGFEAQVTVLVTSYNNHDFIGEAVASVMASEGILAEIVIVDNGSQDTSVSLVRSVMRDHPECPMMLIANSANAGVGAARDTGFGVARTERVFVLDAESYVFPSALHKLSDALDRAPDAAFAYGIIACPGRSGAALDRAPDAAFAYGTIACPGESGIISHLAWDIERLLEGNYIDAMAMLRRSVWEQVGGFGAFCSLRGWADYELWLRIAAYGWEAAFVPELLASHRVHGVSQQNTVELDTEPLEHGALRPLPVPPLPHAGDDNELAVKVRSDDGTLFEKESGTSAEPMETRVVQTPSDPDDNPRILALEAEVGVLRQRVKQREAAMAVLNRRLVALERLDHGGAGILEHAIALEDELERLRQTRMFRWSALLRRVYTQARRVAGV